MFVADIGQNIVEEISLVTPGANLGWNVWEASFRFIRPRRSIELNQRRARSEGHVSDRRIRSPRSAVRQQRRRDRRRRLPRHGDPATVEPVLFGDNPSGEVFYVNADHLPNGGQDPIRRVLFRSGASAKDVAAVDQREERRAEAIGGRTCRSALQVLDRRIVCSSSTSRTARFAKWCGSSAQLPTPNNQLPRSSRFGGWALEVGSL